MMSSHGKQSNFFFPVIYCSLVDNSITVLVVLFLLLLSFFVVVVVIVLCCCSFLHGCILSRKTN